MPSEFFGVALRVLRDVVEAECETHHWQRVLGLRTPRYQFRADLFVCEAARAGVETAAGDDEHQGQHYGGSDYPAIGRFDARPVPLGVGVRSRTASTSARRETTKPSCGVKVILEALHTHTLRGHRLSHSVEFRHPRQRPMSLKYSSAKRSQMGSIAVQWSETEQVADERDQWVGSEKIWTSPQNSFSHLGTS